MEVIVDYYLKEVFETMERGSLLARGNRRQVADYLSIVICGCCLGEGSTSPESACNRLVKSMLAYHARSKSANGQICLLGKYHNLLHVAARLSYDWRLNDTKTICLLLHEIYLCENTFERLLVGAILGTRVTHMITGWKSDFVDREENLDAAEFFLKEATRGRLQLEFTGSRMQDIPMESYGKVSPLRLATQLAASSAVHLLLRFGAATNWNGPGQRKVAQTTVRMLMAKLPCLEAAKTLRYLSRAVPKALESGNGAKLTSPSSLKHLSRCVIREQLYAAWALPEGIYELELPLTLREYLDLQED